VRDMNLSDMTANDLKVIAENLRSGGLLAVMDMVNNHNVDKASDPNYKTVDTRTFFNMVAEVFDAYADIIIDIEKEDDSFTKPADSDDTPYDWDNWEK